MSLVSYQERKLVNSYNDLYIFVTLDHAAIVLKYASAPNQLFFLEATRHGIYIQSYSNIKNYIGNFYYKVVVRHLEFERTDDQIRIMMQFIDEAKDCRFDIPLMEVLFNTQSKPS